METTQETGTTSWLGREVVARLRRPGPPLGRPLPTRIGSLASGISRFAASTSRPVDVRQALRGPEPTGPGQQVRPPRWWVPAAPAEQAASVQRVVSSAVQSGPVAAPSSAASAPPAAPPAAPRWLRPSQAVAVHRLEERGLPRAARSVPQEDSWTPGGILGSLHATVVPVRRFDEVAAAGPMLSATDRARLSASRTRAVVTPETVAPAAPTAPVRRSASSAAATAPTSSGTPGRALPQGSAPAHTPGPTPGPAQGTGQGTGQATGQATGQGTGPTSLGVGPSGNVPGASASSSTPTPSSGVVHRVASPGSTGSASTSGATAGAVPPPSSASAPAGPAGPVAAAPTVASPGPTAVVTAERSVAPAVRLVAAPPSAATRRSARGPRLDTALRRTPAAVGAVPWRATPARPEPRAPRLASALGAQQPVRTSTTGLLDAVPGSGPGRRGSAPNRREVWAATSTVMRLAAAERTAGAASAPAPRTGSRAAGSADPAAAMTGTAQPTAAPPAAATAAPVLRRVADDERVSPRPAPSGAAVPGAPTAGSAAGRAARPTPSPVRRAVAPGAPAPLPPGTPAAPVAPVAPVAAVGQPTRSSSTRTVRRAVSGAAPLGGAGADIAMPELLSSMRGTPHGGSQHRALASGFAPVTEIRPASGARSSGPGHTAEGTLRRVVASTLEAGAAAASPGPSRTTTTRARTSSASAPAPARTAPTTSPTGAPGAGPATAAPATSAAYSPAATPAVPTGSTPRAAAATSAAATAPPAAPAATVETARRSTGVRRLWSRTAPAGHPERAAGRAGSAVTAPPSPAPGDPGRAAPGLGALGSGPGLPGAPGPASVVARSTSTTAAPPVPAVGVAPVGSSPGPASSTAPGPTPGQEASAGQPVPVRRWWQRPRAAVAPSGPALPAGQAPPSAPGPRAVRRRAGEASTGAPARPVAGGLHGPLAAVPAGHAGHAGHGGGLTVSPPPVVAAPRAAAPPPVPDIARTSATSSPSRSSGLARTSPGTSPGTTPVPGAADGGSLVSSTAHLFRAAVGESLGRSTPPGGASPMTTSPDLPGSSLRRLVDAPGGGLDRAAAPAADTPSRLEAREAIDDLVDLVVDRIEQRVVDELERRGRRHDWTRF